VVVVQGGREFATVASELQYPSSSRNREALVPEALLP